MVALGMVKMAVAVVEGEKGLEKGGGEESTGAEC